MGLTIRTVGLRFSIGWASSSTQLATASGLCRHAYPPEVARVIQYAQLPAWQLCLSGPLAYHALSQGSVWRNKPLPLCAALQTLQRLAVGLATSVDGVNLLGCTISLCSWPLEHLQLILSVLKAHKLCAGCQEEWRARTEQADAARKLCLVRQHPQRRRGQRFPGPAAGAAAARARPGTAQLRANCAHTLRVVRAAAPLALALAGAGAPAAGWQADRGHAMLLQAGEAGGESNSPTSRPELPLISGGADSAPALPPHTPQRFSTCTPSAAASPPSAQVRPARLVDKAFSHRLLSVCSPAREPCQAVLTILVPDLVPEGWGGCTAPAMCGCLSAAGKLRQARILGRCEAPLRGVACLPAQAYCCWA